MSAHTPGPWTVVLRGERGTFHIPEARSHEAEHADDGVDGHTVSSANARLIAAAPELLEALKAITEGMDMAGGDGYGMSECPWCHKDDFEAEHKGDCELLSARAAIAKAVGVSG